MPYKLIITGPVGSGKTTAIESLTDQAALSTDVPVSDEITSARKSTTTVAMDYGTLKIDDSANSMVNVYGTPGQERFDFMWDILSEGADGLIILLDNNRNYPYRDLKFFSEQFADFIKESGRLIIGITRLDVREPLLPEVYEDWVMQLGLNAEIINIDPRKKQEVLNLVHKVLDLTPIKQQTIAGPSAYESASPRSQSTKHNIPQPLRATESNFEINQKAMAAINGLGGVTGVSITSEMGELLDSTIEDESLNQFIAYLSGAPCVRVVVTPNFYKMSGANRVYNGLFHRTKGSNTQEVIATS